MSTKVDVLVTVCGECGPNVDLHTLRQRLSWEDVDLLRRATVGEWSRFCDDPPDFDRDHDAEARLHALADLIAALLLPQRDNADDQC